MPDHNCQCDAVFLTQPFYLISDGGTRVQSQVEKSPTKVRPTLLNRSTPANGNDSSLRSKDPKEWWVLSTNKCPLISDVTACPHPYLILLHYVVS